MPHCPELSPHSGPLPAEETKLGRTEIKAGEMRVEFSEPPWGSASCRGPQPYQGCSLLYYLPSGLPAPWELSCLRASFSLCHVSEQKSPTVREPYQNEVSLKSGAEIIVYLLGQSCLNQAGNRKWQIGSIWGQTPPGLFVWIMAKCVNLIFLTMGQHRSVLCS